MIGTVQLALLYIVVKESRLYSHSVGARFASLPSLHGSPRAPHQHKKEASAHIQKSRFEDCIGSAVGILPLHRPVEKV